MLIDEMTEEIYSALHDLWDKNAHRLPDEMRDPDLLDYFLFQDQGATKLYLVEDRPTLIMLGEIKEGLTATVLLLNHEFAEVGQILREMRQIIDEFELKRLTAQVPGPAKDLSRTLASIGFRREGHLRRSMFYNGRLVGTDIFALYKDPPFEKRPSRSDRPNETSRREFPLQPQRRSPLELEAPASRQVQEHSAETAA